MQRLPDIQLTEGKQLYFASDFHLGAPNPKESLKRERRIVSWLEEVRSKAAAIFLMGDLFDFWFEYKHAVPKGGVRLQGKLAELADSGLPIYIFSGNHDMWMKDYFPKEFGIPVYHEPHEVLVNDKLFLIGHGDGLGPGDRRYKLLKRVFRNSFSQWLFGKLHPDLGIGIANAWSQQSRSHNQKKDEEFLGDDEWLLAYCKHKEAQKHHDFYVFGHRHLPLDLAVGNNARYINLGEWISHNTYGAFNGQDMELLTFSQDA